MKTSKLLLFTTLIMAMTSIANGIVDPCPPPCPEPCIDVEKTVCPEVSKVGDCVTYEICVTNCGETLLLDIIVEDPLLGVYDYLPALVPGETVCLEPIKYEIPEGAPNPLVNKVKAVGMDKNCTEVKDYDYAEVKLVEPCIKIEKMVNNPEPCFGDTIIYTICIKNTGDWPLENVEVKDKLLNPIYGSPLPGFPTELAIGEKACQEFKYVVPKDAPCPLVNTARVDSDPKGPMKNPINDEVCVKICPEPCGGEGCTPGFWKNNGDKHGASAWCDLFDPSDPFSWHFSLIETLVIRGNGKSKIKNPTLLQALGANGGGVNAMIRHGVAAMLNACSKCVKYPIDDPFEVIFMIQETLNGAPGAYTVDELHSMFAGYNEAGCPVNQHGECVGVDD
ncbi:MAG: DUF7507 domain-containing protein [Planctomycetota bacterium]|jgi:uncharacterized repeat protein (TIGR01451 family)